MTGPATRRSETPGAKGLDPLDESRHGVSAPSNIPVGISLAPGDSANGGAAGGVAVLRQRRSRPRLNRSRAAPKKRLELNLLGQVDTAAGESRRNENVPFNLVDNNALKELNVRLGTTATIVREFSPGSNYFGSEFGNPPMTALSVISALEPARTEVSMWRTSTASSTQDLFSRSGT